MPDAQARKRSHEDGSPQRRKYGFTKDEISEFKAKYSGEAWDEWKADMIKYSQAANSGDHGMKPVKESHRAALDEWKADMLRYAREGEELRSKRADEMWEEDKLQIKSEEVAAWKRIDEKEKNKTLVDEDVEMGDADGQEAHRSPGRLSKTLEEYAEKSQVAEDQSATGRQSRHEQQAREQRARMQMAQEKRQARVRDDRSYSVQPAQPHSHRPAQPLARGNFDSSLRDYVRATSNDDIRTATKDQTKPSPVQVLPPLTLKMRPLSEEQSPIQEESPHGQEDQGPLTEPPPHKELNAQPKKRQQDGAAQVRPAKQGRSLVENQDQSAGTKTKSKEKVPLRVSSEKQKGKQAQKAKPAGDDTEPAEDPTSLFIPENGPPEWYVNATFGKRETKALVSSQQVKAMEALKDCIRRCLRERNDKVFDELRDHVHKAEFLDMTKFALKKTFVFDTPATPPANRMGLRRIFEDPVFPWDLQEDARQLYIRWWHERLSPDLLRGIRRSKTSQKEGLRNNDSIDPGYNKPSAKYHGQGDLVMGQWWPTQLCTVRDGAHGSAQGGIFGEKGSGAYSIVLSGGAGYEDEDHGERILYSGTEGKDMVPSEATSRLIESCDKVGEPVRVIRSMNLKKPNKYRPEVGYRYDGLYEVVGYELRNKMKATYRFELVRCPGQNPIRFEGKEARPTYWEKEEYAKLKLDAKFAGM